MRRAISNLDLGTSLWHNRDQSLASLALKNESDGLAMNFRDRSILIKDTVTPANNFSGNVNNKLVFAAISLAARKSTASFPTSPISSGPHHSLKQKNSLVP